MKIVILGATGSLGKALTHFLIGKVDIVRVFSRDELKQSEMAKEFNTPNIRFFIGDIRDKERLMSAFSGADVVIHTAAMKQVPACEYNPYEAVKTNIIGTQNVISACVANNIKKAILISTDKAVDPINLYGATKLVAEKLWINANQFSNTKFSFTRYGNVIGSRGSVVPLFREQAKTGTITVTDPEMTRFILTIDQAVEFVWDSLQKMKGGEKFIPKNLPAVNIMDLAEHFLNTELNHIEIKIIGVRQGEKIHEYLDDNYCSKDCVKPIDEIKHLLW